MDDILHTPGQEVRSARLRRVIPEDISGRSLGSRLRGAGSAILDGAELLRRSVSRLFHRLDSTAVGGKLWGPAAFLAAAGFLGVALVVSTVYTPSYVVTVDGVDLGTVRDPQVFEDVMDRVEARATAILGYDYDLGSQVDYEFALIEKDALSSVSGFETYLFNHIGEVMKSYVLTVDGQFIGAASDIIPLNNILDAIKAPYINENTIESDFVEPVSIVHEFTPSDIMQDLDHMSELLTANTTGETSYEVQKGDTFSAIAYANDMSIDELEALNPSLDINKLYVGQVLTVREAIPFLSVRTVDAVEYTEEIPCPVREVQDNTMYQGDKKTVTTGVPGEALVNADITYVNGIEKERTVTAYQVLSEATETVVHVGTKARPKTMATGHLKWPLAVNGTITSKYGYRTIFGTYSFHSGIDIGAAHGISIKAADGGKVIFAGEGNGSTWSYGKYVVIDHENGLKTIYAHCSSLNVKAGDRVYQGQVIAKVGSTGRTTGPHLHFQVKYKNVTVNPWNYLNK